MSKKPYAAPTVTDLGNAVKQTKGVSGVYWESYGNQYGPPIKPPGDDVSETESKENA